MSWRVAHALVTSVTLGSLAACGGGPGGAETPWRGTGPVAAAAGSGAQAGPGTAAAPVDCSQVTYAPQRIWRLTPAQFDNTLKDLLGIESAFGAGFPADDVGVGFSNAADALLMTPLLADKVQSAAQDSATKVELSRLALCAGSQRDETCLRQIVTQFGERAFRRPLTAAEVERYFTLAKAPSDFETGARLVVNAMLQSPYFLYRFEVGHPGAQAGVNELDDYEIASEVSYLLWQSMPDDALFAAAKSRRLRDKAELAQQVQRMLASPRARPVVRRFVFDWLGLSTIATVPKDNASFPELTPAIRAAMVTEAEAFVDTVMFGQTAATDGSIAALLNAPSNAMDPALGAFYAARGGTGPARRGMLTLGGVLLTHSRSNDSSPIHRGKLVREKLLCQPLPPPPPGLVLQPPGLDPTKTARQRYAEHSENEYCGSCHKLMDPIGLAFEHYDGVGRYRASDNGLPIDASGSIVQNDTSQYPATDADGSFTGTDGLIDKLEASQDVQRCYALEWFRFAYGEGKTEREGAGYPSCQAKRFQELVAQTPGSLVDIVQALTQSDWFLARAAAEPAGPTTPPVSTPEPTPTATPTPNANAGAPAAMDGLPAGLAMERTVDNDWGAGYCYTYQLRNTSGAPLTWSVTLDVRGMMNNHWQCKVSAETGRVTFSGEDYNKTIAPNASAEFGFCAVVSSGS